MTSKRCSKKYARPTPCARRAVPNCRRVRRTREVPDRRGERILSGPIDKKPHYSLPSPEFFTNFGNHLVWWKLSTRGRLHPPTGPFVALVRVARTIGVRVASIFSGIGRNSRFEKWSPHGARTNADRDFALWMARSRGRWSTNRSEWSR